MTPWSSSHAEQRTTRIATTIAVLTLCVTSTSHALELSRGRAVGRALRGHEAIAAARAVEDQARARGEQVRAAGLPRIETTVALGTSLRAELQEGTTVQSTKNAYGDVRLSDLSAFVGLQLQVLQPLYTFGKISERKRAARLEARARGAQTQMKEAEIAFAVAEMYETYLFARDAARFFEETDLWLRRAIEDTERELAARTGATEQDLLALQTGRHAVRLGLSQARTGAEQLTAGLIAYLAWPPGTTLEPAEAGLETLTSTPTTGLPELVELALSSRPELLALAAGGDALRALAEAEAAGNHPDLFALGFVSAAYTPGRDWIQTRFVVDQLNHFVPGAMVGMRWTLSGSGATARAEETRARASELDHNLSWARLALPAEVTRAYEDWRRAVRDIAEADAGSSIAKKWMVRASADYSVGLGSSHDLTEAAEAFVSLRVASLEAILRHNVALAALARSTGTLRPGQSRFYPTE